MVVLVQLTKNRKTIYNISGRERIIKIKNWIPVSFLLLNQGG